MLVMQLPGSSHGKFAILILTTTTRPYNTMTQTISSRISMHLSHYVVAILLLSPFCLVMADSHLASCFHISSDQDGDGFGFENSASCIVDDTTNHLTEPNVCIDDNADGYGWNGVETCLIDIPPATDCVDTDPQGDGWGWNGSESCRVVAQPTTETSELEVIKSRLINIPGRTDRKIAAFNCPSTDETVYLKISGFIEYFIGGTRISEGVWATGLYDRDDQILVQYSNQDYFSFPYSTIQLESDRVRFGNTNTLCDWLTD